VTTVCHDIERDSVRLLVTANFEVVEGAVAVPGGKLVKVTANDDLSLNLTTLGMMTAAKALNELDAYCGRNG
jgi:hypothetical protein